MSDLSESAKASADGSPHGLSVLPNVSGEWHVDYPYDNIFHTHKDPVAKSVTGTNLKYKCVRSIHSIMLLNITLTNGEGHYISTAASTAPMPCVSYACEREYALVAITHAVPNFEQPAAGYVHGSIPRTRRQPDIKVNVDGAFTSIARLRM